MLYNFYQYETLAYFIEVLIAELLFLHTLKRRSYFFIRLTVSVVIGAFLVSIIGMMGNTMNSLAIFLKLLVIISISYVCMMLSYKGNAFLVFSSCMAGVATQHVANKFQTLVFLLPIFKNINLSGVYIRIFSEIIIFSMIYIVIYAVFASKFSPEQSSLESSLLSIVIIITCIGVNRLVVDNGTDNVYYTVAVCIYAIICCIFALTIQFYFYKWQQEKSEALIIKRLLSTSEKQYEQWKTSVALNNIHIHDLKHMLNRIEKLSGKEQLEIPDLTPIRDSIEQFSPLVKTGNEVIDVLIRNMDTLCKEQNIRFNCVSYTEELGNFDSMSLYFLFANIIDNARSGADKVKDPEKRIIDMSLKQFGDSVIINIWNYYSGDLYFEDGLPVSQNPEEGHGLGLKSIRMLVEKFEGAMKAKAENDVFRLNIILPLKSK